MSGKTLHIEDFLRPDQLACRISEYFLDWDGFRTEKVREWEEIQRYIFATDTTKTSNAKLPWSNKTTIPKLCQIRDNLHANYLAAMFPRRKWLTWEGASQDAESVDKKRAIESYMAWVIDRPEFYFEMTKIVLDYIDYGNCFAMPEWVDKTHLLEDGRTKVGYVGPMIRRISPLDIVFNPLAPDFASSPKIIRSLVSIGEIKAILEQETVDEYEKECARELFKYMKELRQQVGEHPGNATTKDNLYQVAGFSNYRDYLESDYCEVLTFYGDIYDAEKDELLRNQCIKVVDRHKIMSKNTHPSWFGQVPIYHVGWRVRPDNLWAMGPLDNLVGMQYRIDHLENMKADVWDLTAYPPLKVKGYVEDFEWGPFERIYIGDDGSDVEMMSPDPSVLQANTEIAILEQKMEEMAGAPKEAMGFRTPGEKTKYEVQRIENAAARIFEAKTGYLEMHGTEKYLNSMLELGRRLMTSTTIRVFDSELKIAAFQTLTPEDITGHGRIKPYAARHFAEKAQQLQDINGFLSSPAGQDPNIAVHFSGVGLARLHENLLGLEVSNIVQPFIRLSEQADGQRLANVAQEQVGMDTLTPSGLAEDDYDTIPSEESFDTPEGPDGSMGTGLDQSGGAGAAY
jgi:hypothetical protein